jgi:hypothetical protein
MVEGIVNSILSGVTSGLWHMLGAIPLSVYLVAFVSLVAVVFILRYATNWKVDLTVMAAVFIVSEILARPPTSLSSPATPRTARR